MNQNNFHEQVIKVYKFFGKASWPDNELVTEWYQSIKGLPSMTEDAWDFIKGQIYQLDTLPRNLPKTIKKSWSNYIKLKPTETSIEYDIYEDIRYPMELMKKAVALLEDKGPHFFHQFCMDTNMPHCDMNRCISKADYQMDPYPMTDELKSARWKVFANLYQFSFQDSKRIINGLMD